MKTTLALIAFTFTAAAGEWTNISDATTATVKPGYAGPTAGVVADRVTGVCLWW